MAIVRYCVTTEVAGASTVTVLTGATTVRIGGAAAISAALVDVLVAGGLEGYIAL